MRKRVECCAVDNFLLFGALVAIYAGFVRPSNVLIIIREELAKLEAR